jgi:hypothetical protein
LVNEIAIGALDVLIYIRMLILSSPTVETPDCHGGCHGDTRRSKYILRLSNNPPDPVNHHLPSSPALSPPRPPQTFRCPHAGTSSLCSTALLDKRQASEISNNLGGSTKQLAPIRHVLLRLIADSVCVADRQTAIHQPRLQSQLLGALGRVRDLMHTMQKTSQ